MPCVAKKFEKNREDQSAAGVPDVDAVLTTRELAKMIKGNGIIFNELPNTDFDAPLGEHTGAGVILGATGGVMEAALRTAVETLTGEKLDSVDFTEVRGTAGIKEATYKVAGLEVSVAVASGLENAKALCEQIKNGTCKYQFIEIMGCPGGCVNGGGQPIQSAFVRRNTDIRALRASVLYQIDAASKVRKSHENAMVTTLYKEYFGEPGSHKAHEVLHTSYVKRNKY